MKNINWKIHEDTINKYNGQYSNTLIKNGTSNDTIITNQQKYSTLVHYICWNCKIKNTYLFVFPDI